MVSNAVEEARMKMGYVLFMCTKEREQLLLLFLPS